MIYADKKETISTDLLYADLTYKIRRCIFNVYNELGFGHKENVYQKFLQEEFDENGISYKREKSVGVKYKNVPVGNYRPDFIVDEKVLIELKAVGFMPKSYEDQVIHYLKSTGYKLGLLINFGSPRLIIKRLVWTKHQRESAKNQRES